MAIEVQRIMQPETLLSLTGFISLFKKPKVLVPFVIFCLLGGVMFLVFLLPLVILWPLTKRFPQAMYFKYSVEKRMRAEADEAFTKFIGKPVKYKDTTIAAGNGNEEALSGYGLAYDDSVVYMMEHGLAAKIPWSEVRKWSWNVDGYSTTAVYGGNLANNMSGNMAAAVNNANAKASAYRDSGFFVDVADIEHPRWQYMTIDKKLLTRWMEIFKQVNEGKL